ncbi:MAG: hypothetical protein BWY89_00394 [Bacteroidetes bacterium ADurb.BinA012]|nr:MAG: hypothetical protein BWY89_00394 [Bacteroidetes bacterium ADurb.BinA012]
MKTRLILMVALSAVLSGCMQNEEKAFPDKNFSKRSISIDAISLDTVVLDKIEYSFDGILQIYSDNLSFIDKNYGLIYNFDTSGKLISKDLGKGRGPGEIESGYIEGHTVLQNGEHVFIGSSSDVHILDKDWKYVKRLTMDWHFSTPDAGSVPNPDPAEPIVYTLDYANFKVLSDSKNNAYMPIYSENPYFNGMMSESYYKNGRILLKMDLSDGYVVDLFGRRSPEYLKYRFLPQHATFYFDIDKSDRFYISHEIDSLIYVYDHDFKPLYSFGNKGIDMNTEYTELSEFDAKKFRKLFFEDKPQRGYYKDIILFEDMDDLLFRSYSKGYHTPYDGLQIYRDKTLIADLDVPKGFKVIGYLPPFFYSDLFYDEDLDELSVLRFRLFDN